MFHPRIPINPAPTGDPIPILTPTAITQPGHPHAPTCCACRHAAPAPVAPVRPTAQLTPGSLLAVVGGGTAVVLVVGAVLVSVLLAVAVTATALAICALVIRSLIGAQAKQR
ncbi:SpdD-like protein [Streptomyces kanamyceticus]|uniref:SpdD-like protein n=1 Tax=Streptomyces kanamyceticus TaxID=1967 RepID=A0A5J6GJJ2_STRKN|nr:SpdD-like protein [Streptomyces kanamyceticus]QEU93988.1 SpdD-like protein [Streptomyces kanamyceticus]